MKPLIDGDILRYEIGSCCHYTDDNGEPRIRGFDYCIELLHEKVELICKCVDATEPPTIFLTMCEKTHKITKCPQPFKKNFRFDIAKKKPYKGNRNNSEKPYHFDNLTAYIVANFECVVANGL